ncbi:MAG: thioredoxin family protein [Ignavibacteria bacterium]|nr:thioredoxin family protein [Ignavibacteriota bacterium]
MKASKILFTVIISLFIVTGTYAQNSQTFNSGLNAAKSSGKKIFLYIYSESDSWSKKTDTEVIASDGVKKALEAFTFIRLNADSPDKFTYNKKEYTSSDLAKQFGGTGYPTFVFMNPDGSVISFKYNGDVTSNISGFMGADDFADMLNFFAQNKHQNSDLSTIFSN